MNEYKTKLSFKEIRKKTISLADLKKNLTRKFQMRKQKKLPLLEKLLIILWSN